MKTMHATGAPARLLALCLFSIGAIACGSSGGDSAAPGGGGKADEAAPSCFVCASKHMSCLDRGGSDPQCRREFAECFVDTTGTIPRCDDSGDHACGECLEHDTDRESLITMADCILETFDVEARELEGRLYSAAEACPAPTSCDDCSAQLAACHASAQDGASTNDCLGAFAACHTAATGQVLSCDKPGCDDCLEHSTDFASIEVMNRCILVDANAPEAATCDLSCVDCQVSYDQCMADFDVNAAVEDIAACDKLFGECRSALGASECARPLVCLDCQRDFQTCNEGGSSAEDRDACDKMFSQCRDGLELDHDGPGCAKP